MKITDSANRQMSVDVLTKASGSYLPPLEFSLDNSRRIYLRTSSGPIAFRTMSDREIDAIFFVNGQMLVGSRKLSSGLNVIERDDSGNAMTFNNGQIDVAQMRCEDPAQSLEMAQLQESLATNLPKGGNVVVAIFRFAKENTVVHEPPQQEYMVVFELNEPDTHDFKFAQNFHHVVFPGEFIDPQEVGSGSDKPKFQFRCTCTGCRN